MWVVKNTGCDVIVDDEEDAAMVVSTLRGKKIVYLIRVNTRFRHFQFTNQTALSQQQGHPWVPSTHSVADTLKTEVWVSLVH